MRYPHISIPNHWIPQLIAYFTITWPSVRDGISCFWLYDDLPDVKMKEWFTDRASCPCDGFRPCDYQNWTTVVDRHSCSHPISSSSSRVLRSWRLELPMLAKDMERICSHLMSDGRHWTTSFNLSVVCLKQGCSEVPGLWIETKRAYLFENLSR